MWADAQRDGRPAEYMWRMVFNAAVWLTPTTTVPCSNAAKMRNPKLPDQSQPLVEFTILSESMEEILLINKFFSDCRYVP